MGGVGKTSEDGALRGGEWRRGPVDGQEDLKFVYVLTAFATVGGFLFGYDTGIVSGAILQIKKEFNLSTVWIELTVSGTIGAAAVFALVGSVLSDKLGRRRVIMAASAIFTVGAIVMGSSPNKYVLFVGRVVVGAGIGFASMTVPVYIAEAAPSNIRGKLVTINQLFITFGILFANIAAGGLSYVEKTGWRYMLGLSGLPSVVQFVGFVFLPESPRWLTNQGRDEEARKILVSIRKTEEVDSELNEIKRSCEEYKQLQGNAESLVLFRILKTPHVRKALFVGCGAQFFQQMCGINTVIYYSATIIKMAGVRDDSQAIWYSSIIGVVNVCFTLAGVLLVERQGRKLMMVGSLLGVTISCVVLAIGFQLSATHAPSVTTFENDTSTDGRCASYRNCFKCIEDTYCGYCYIPKDHLSTNGSCLPTDPEKNTQSTWGRCNRTEVLSERLQWGYDFCPTNYYWMPILGLAMYVMFFAPGMGPMPWVINSEIYPMWARSTGNGMATAMNWVCNLIISMTFITLTEVITKYEKQAPDDGIFWTILGTFWLFTGICGVGLLFLLLALPETMNKSLEEVEKLFMTGGKNRVISGRVEEKTECTKF